MNFRRLRTILANYPNTSKFDWTVSSYGTNYYARIKHNNNYVASYHPTSLQLCLLDLLDQLLLEEV